MLDEGSSIFLIQPTSSSRPICNENSTSKKDFDCGITAVAMLLCGGDRLTRNEAYSLAESTIDPNRRTRIGQLSDALRKLGRPLKSGKMRQVLEGGLPNIPKDALVLVRFTRNKSLHWMVWDHRRQVLLDPDSDKSHFIEYHVLKHIQVAA